MFFTSVKTADMTGNDWKIPLNLAIAIHVLIALGSVYLPGLFKASPKFAEIYTVNLVTVEAPAPPPPAPPAPVKSKPTPPQEIKKVEPVKKAVPIEPAVEEPVAPEPVEAVSLKPLKKKEKKVVKPKPESTIDREKQKRQREALAKALKEEELLAQQARLAQEALENERRLLESANKPAPSTSQSSQSSVPSSSASSSSSNLIDRQYHSAIFSRLHQFWSIPEYLQDDSTLLAVVVITINQDGSIADMFFEQRSGNRVFDQFVSTTINDASPLPPIPPAMKKQRYEIGLKFRPGGIQ